MAYHKLCGLASESKLLLTTLCSDKIKARIHYLNRYTKLGFSLFDGGRGVVMCNQPISLGINW